MNEAIDDVAVTSFELVDNVLVTNVELYWENHGEFLAYCRRLIESKHDHIVLDFSHVNFIFSAYMGTIGKLVADIVKADKRLTIRVSQNLKWLFEIVGFEKIVNIECVP